MSPREVALSPGRRALHRSVLVSLFMVFLGLLAAPAALAEPTNHPEPQLDQLPAHLKKYVPDSADWATSPWMTSVSCQDKGGDFSMWAAHVIADAADIMGFFSPLSYHPNPDYWRTVYENYRTLANEIGPNVPQGYCVDDMKRWAGTNPETKPFGFDWGLSQGSGYMCTWRRDIRLDRSEDYRNRWMGAERAPCDGFHVNCDNASEADWPRCDAWNYFSDSFIDRTEKARRDAAVKYPARGQAEVNTEVGGKIPEIVGDIALGWFEDLTRAIATGSANLLAEAMTFWTRTDRSSMLQSPAIGEIQGLLRWVGLVVLIGSVMWQAIMLLYRKKPDPLVSAGMGLLSYVGWSTLGTTAAVLLYEGGNALATQVLEESINKFSERMGAAMQANVVPAVAVIFFLAIILFFLACIQWVLGFFRMGALVILLALIPTAAAGQVNEATKPWLRKVLSWSLSLILYQPIAAVIFAIGFVLIGEGTDLSTILTGMAVLCLAVISMPTMMRFFDWGGQRLTTGSGGGSGAMAVGAAASALGGGGAAGFSRFMDRHGPAAGRTGGADPGAPPVAPAHTGDGPGSGRDGDRSGSAGAHRPSGSDVAPAHAGAGDAARGTATTTAGANAATGAASAAGPGGAAVVAAQAAKDKVSGAMTGGSPDTTGGS